MASAVSWISCLTAAASAPFVRSGMGQMFTFSYEDVQAMARTACSHLKGRAVLVGTTGIWDRDRNNYPIRRCSSTRRSS